MPVQSGSSAAENDLRPRCAPIQAPMPGELVATREDCDALNTVRRGTGPAPWVPVRPPRCQPEKLTRLQHVA
jgi:hypothetical protein